MRVYRVVFFDMLDLGVTKNLFWGLFRVILGSFWGHFGVILGKFRGHYGVILGL